MPGRVIFRKLDYRSDYLPLNKLLEKGGSPVTQWSRIIEALAGMVAKATVEGDDGRVYRLLQAVREASRCLRDGLRPGWCRYFSPRLSQTDTRKKVWISDSAQLGHFYAASKTAEIQCPEHGAQFRAWQTRERKAGRINAFTKRRRIQHGL